MNSTQASLVERIPFSQLLLSRELLKAIADLGFEETSPIQTQAIPLIQQGRDIIGLAQTGTGKTAAFGLPILDKVDSAKRATQVLILTPTRELAIQVSEDLKSYAQYKRRIHILPIYGGQPIGRQIYALHCGVHIIIATPGRLLDHLARQTIFLHEVNSVVLDEADEMLDMGFRDDIETILKQISTKRQTMLFSATMSSEIMQLTKKYLHNPVVVQVAFQQQIVPKIEQAAFRIHEEDKVELLSRLIDYHDFQKVLIFVNTKKGVDGLTERLKARGFLTESLHGDMNQRQRDAVMKKFREGTVEFLVASDVAARGLDIDDIEAVFNFDVPQDTEDYVHRIGRTARAGKEGKAFTFVTSRQSKFFYEIEHFIKQKIPFLPLPSSQDVKQQHLKQLAVEIKKELEDNHFVEYLPLVERMIERGIEIKQALAVLIKMHLEENISFGSEELQSPQFLHQERGTARRGVKRFFDRKKLNEPLITLILNVGKNHGIEIKDIVGAIAGETGINGSNIGKIRIGVTTSTIEIPKSLVAIVLSKMKGKRVKRTPVDITR